VIHALHVIGSAPVPPENVPAWVAKGFRPFFLLAGGFAALIVALWLVALAGGLQVHGYLAPMYWHAHEMVFGFTVAIVAVLVTLAAVIRVLGPLSISTYSIALYVSGALWSLGFAIFTVAYARILVQPRIDGRPG
jgi:uncharacterized protein involved in response to NO